MKKKILLAGLALALHTIAIAQFPYFKSGDKSFQTNGNGSETLKEYKDLRSFVKYPNVILFKEQVCPNLTIAPQNVLYQGVYNTFTGIYTIMERNRRTLDFSVYNYNAITNVRTELFNQASSPVAGKAIKPIGFVSSNVLLIEALEFDSHLDHEGVYSLNVATLIASPIAIDSKYMSTPILNNDLTNMYYISTTDATRDVIHGNYNVLKSYSFLNNSNSTLYTSTQDPIDFVGWEPNSEDLQLQAAKIVKALNEKALVQYLLPYDSLTAYYVSRHGTPAPSGVHVSSGYDAVYTQYNAHGYPAVDFDTPDTQNDNILASAPGTVTFSGISCGLTCGYGRLVIIEHADGWRTYNGHMIQIYASVDDCVGYGSVIGKEGTSGGSTGDHQHFEWRAAGGNTSTLGTFDDVGQPRQGYRYVSHTPTLACNISNPVSAPTDQVDPSTLVTAPAGWVTTNFTANFADADNSGGSGIEKAFYQVIDNNAGEWRANGQRGFFADNFDLPAINPEWTVQTGTWGINTMNLRQTNEALSNTNISAYVKSTMSNRYLYEFEAKIEGTGTNKRAGFHYFSDNATLPNRGNGYFAWFKVDADMIELYKVTNDVFTLISSQAYNFTAATWYNFKIAYDRTSGKTQIFINDAIAHSYTDSNPYLTGDYVSFRSGECVFSVNQLKVYRTRLAASTILVGVTGDIRYSNTNPTSPAGRIKSVVTDVAGNISTIDSDDVNVDTSIPLPIATVNDGSSADLDVTANASSFAANWTSSTDPNSGISKYYYSIGTSAGAVNTTPWTDNGPSTTIALAGLSLVTGTTYYVNIKSENAAGLQSIVTSSDGILIQSSGNIPVAAFLPSNTTFCNADSVQYSNQSQNATSFLWSFPGGSPATSTLTNPKVFYPVSGSYTSTLISINGANSDTVLVTDYYNVFLSPVAAFTPNQTTVDLSAGGTITFSNTSTNATTYTWNFGNNGGATTEQNPYYTYDTPGIYNVTLTATNVSCGSNSTTVQIIVTDVLALNNQSSNGFNVNYDQLSNTLLVTSKANKNEKVRLVNTEGKLVYEGKLNFTSNIKTEIQLNKNIANGIYFLNIGDTTIKLALSRN
jgi:murein DD-endopeptidase MepM/ murein hydrolase activator NlpD/PKD repeat protein